MNTADVIENRIGVNANGDNTFRGLSAKEDIVGQLDFWSLQSLAVGKRTLTREEAEYFEQLMLGMNASDPHIWPLKLVWLASGYGEAFSGLASLIAAFPRASLGTAPIEEAARQVEKFIAVNDLELSPFIDDILAKEEVIPGFGVIGREHDERAEILEKVCHKYGFDSRPCYLRMKVVRSYLIKKKIDVNVGGMVAILLMDLGFNPQQTSLMACSGLWTSMMANAVDAANMQPSVLRKLPQDRIKYVGRARRLSPRKKEQTEAELV